MADPTDYYLELSGRSEGLYKEKGSKFIAIAFPVYTEDEVKDQLAMIRKEFYDARHHCYAYILGIDKNISKSNDDGEPSGTAGKPILNQILSKGLTNTCVVVVRYFGGTKLGVSGLVTAYKTAARDAIENGIAVERTIHKVFGITFNYPLMNEVMRLIKEENLETRNQRFEIQCYLEILVNRSEGERISMKFSRIFGVEIKNI